MRFGGNGKVAEARFRRWSRIILVLAPALMSAPARAVDPDWKISQYAHTSWRLQDGFFSDLPHAMAQTQDGYLWMGTRIGILRFDGVRSVPFTTLGGKSLPAGPIGALLGASDGSLWIGSATGLVHWKGGKLIPYPAIPGDIVQILEDAEGVIWVARNGGHDNVGPLCRISNGITKCFNAAEGISSDLCCAESLALGTDGSVWVGNGDTVLQLRANSVTTRRLAVSLSGNAAGMRGLAASADGSVWVGMAVRGRGLGLQKLVKGAWKRFVAAPLNGSSLEVTHLLMDHHGALWVGTADKGIYRIHNDKVDHFSKSDGLTSDFVSWIFEDREGNIWVRTAKGLDSFRDFRVATWSAHEGFTADNVSSTFAAHDGTVWVGNANGLDSIKDGQVSSIRTGKGLPGDRVTSIFEDHSHRLWVGIDDDLTIFESGHFKKVIGKNGRQTGPIAGITEDTKGNIWAQVYGDDQRLLRVHGDTIQEEFRNPQTRLARTLAVDGDDNVWMGLKDGNLAVYRHGTFETISYEHTKQTSVREVIVDGDGSVLGATSYGVIGWRRGKKTTLSVRNGLPCDATLGLVLDKAGDLWVSMPCGVAEIDKAELQRWWNDPSTKIRLKINDAFDGVQTGSAHFDAGTTRSPDGRLWFATGSVLQMIDPSRLDGNRIIPPVHIEEIVADHRVYPAQDGVRLPALTRDLEIDYTALSFIAPQKVRFRYRLDGHETEWQDPGTRRQALYNDLPPGKYRFHVIACNNDGLWNEAGATLDFVVPPALYQTWWFRLMCGVTAAAALWMFYLYRLKQATAKIQERLGGRLEERERIARELHDTLLQGFQGLVLRFQAVMKILPENEAARK